MPRKPRMFIAGVPCHVIQRGNNRQVCFFDTEDYQFYLTCVADACEKYRVSLHAYVLMTNHVHLLITPCCSQGISKAMQSIGRRYVQYINRKYNRTGTLFEGRFKSSLIQADNYLLACMRYIELNPVRANMVAHPALYKWSSYRVNAGLSPRKSLVAHESYLSLAVRDDLLFTAYNHLFIDELALIDESIFTPLALCSMPVGDNRFTEEIEKTLGFSIGQKSRGRPKQARK